MARSPLSSVTAVSVSAACALGALTAPFYRQDKASPGTNHADDVDPFFQPRPPAVRQTESVNDQPTKWPLEASNQTTRTTTGSGNTSEARSSLPLWHEMVNALRMRMTLPGIQPAAAQWKPSSPAAGMPASTKDWDPLLQGSGLLGRSVAHCEAAWKHGGEGEEDEEAEGEVVVNWSGTHEVKAKRVLRPETIQVWPYHRVPLPMPFSSLHHDTSFKDCPSPDALLPSIGTACLNRLDVNLTVLSCMTSLKTAVFPNAMIQCTVCHNEIFREITASRMSPSRRSWRVLFVRPTSRGSL